MANAHISTQFQHVMLLKDILHKTIVLPKVKATTFGRDDPSSILTSVLKDSEAVEEHLIDLEKDWKMIHKISSNFKEQGQPLT